MCQKCPSGHHILQARQLLSGLFDKGGEMYQPQRWHLILPAIREWGVLMLLHGVGKIALEKSDVLEEACTTAQKILVILILTA